MLLARGDWQPRLVITDTNYDELTALAQDASSAFNAGSPSAFALEHLLLPTVVAVPEPATWMLVILGLAAFLTLRWRTSVAAAAVAV